MLGRRRVHLSHRHTLIADAFPMCENNSKPSPTTGRSSQAGSAPLAEARVRLHRHGPRVVEIVPGTAGHLPAFTDSILRSDRELFRYTDWSLLEELVATRAVLHGGNGDRAARDFRQTESRWPSNSRSSG